MADSTSSSGNSGALTLAALTEMTRPWANNRKPQCVVIFTWCLGPMDRAMQFIAPVDPEALQWLGPYATDIVEALAEARAGDYVLVVHPVTLDRLCPPHRMDAIRPLESFAFWGIPVQELNLDPEWDPPLIDFFDLPRTDLSWWKHG